jgi:hypothetical protein
VLLLLLLPQREVKAGGVRALGLQRQHQVQLQPALKRTAINSRV